jgi:hypothetical protein
MRCSRCQAEWCWLCARSITPGGAYPAHYKWWNPFGLFSRAFYVKCLYVTFQRLLHPAVVIFPTAAYNSNNAIAAGCSGAQFSDGCSAPQLSTTNPFAIIPRHMRSRPFSMAHDCSWWLRKLFQLICLPLVLPLLAASCAL